MKLSNEDKQLIQRAKTLVQPKKVRGGVLKEVGCVLQTGKGKLFQGVCLDLNCGIGFCAEHTAIATMVTQTNETYVKKIVAVSNKEILPPCGRCRELLNLLDKRNLATEVIISKNQKIQLAELLPSAYEPL